MYKLRNFVLTMLQKKLPGLQEHILLAPYTSFNIGGPAIYFFVAKNEQDVVDAIRAVKANNLNYFILGGGTNILISDKGFDGMVIKLENNVLEFRGMEATVGSGVMLQAFIDAACERGLSGLETIAGIGGTVGGAVRGNAGAFGQSIGDGVTEVVAVVEGEVRKFSHEACEFHYRESIFKKIPAVIISAMLKFSSGQSLALRKKADEIIQKRNSRYNTQWQCAGCVFKNIDLSVTPVDRERLLKALDITANEYEEVTKFGKLPISFIVDKLGYKGKQIGGAKIADEHGAFIINAGGAKAEDVIMLMSIIKTKVRNILGIQLDPEIELVGF